MAQNVICPHCSEQVSIDIDWTILKTRQQPPTVADSFDRSATCSACGETFACKIDSPF